MAHGLGKLIFSIRVLELIPPGIKFKKKKKHGGVYDFWEEDCNGYMGSLCRKLKKTAGSFGGKKGRLGSILGFFCGDGGVLLVFGRAAWRVANFFAATGLAEMLCLDAEVMEGDAEE